VTVAEDLVRRFAWVQGHADVWRLFSDGELLPRIAAALADPFRDATKVAGIEARGFILGAAVAAELGAGFIAIRKDAGLFPGPKLTEQSEPDYRGNRHVLRIQRDSLGPGDRVVLVDDWAEIGSQALAARTLIERCGATFAGLSIVIDQLEEETRSRIGRVHALVSAADLGPSA
jgi:adenine phosphoribosyltransferase